MKMKFNWGTGILLVIIFFLLSVIAFFIYISNLDINLVEDNYYEKELAYQQRIDKINNATAMQSKIEILKEPGKIILQFPQSDTTLFATGTVWFYRPSDPKKDFTLPLQLNDSCRQEVDIRKIDKGRWVVKLEWEMNGNEYYFEEGLIIEH